MHDPLTQAFEIKYPWRSNSRARMKEKAAARGVPVDHPSLDFERTYHDTFIRIWHRDPETDGSDDSCGWFMRARHGDKRVRDEIRRRFAFEWHTGVPHGWFNAEGDPNYSSIGIVVNMFRIAAHVMFGWGNRLNWFMWRHIHQIIEFAENPQDSLYTAIHRPYGKDESEEERIAGFADCVYSWILRETRPWWKHPRWHVHHWHVQIPPIQDLRRWLFSRCSHCGGGFKYGESPVSHQWDSDGPRWFRSERSVYHSACSSAAVPSRQA
jgi:hypothetical protein